MSLGVQINVTEGVINSGEALINLASPPAGTVRNPTINGSTTAMGLAEFTLPAATGFGAVRLDNIPGYDDVGSYTLWTMFSYDIDAFPGESSFSFGMRERATGSLQEAFSISTDGNNPDDLVPVQPMMLLPPGWDPYVSIDPAPGAGDHVLYFEFEMMRDPGDVLSRLTQLAPLTAG